MVSDNPETFADLDGHFWNPFGWYAALLSQSSQTQSPSITSRDVISSQSFVGSGSTTDANGHIVSTITAENVTESWVRDSTGEIDGVQRTVTTVSFGADPGDEGKLLGATQTVTLETTSEPNAQTTSISYNGARSVIGDDTVTRDQSDSAHASMFLAFRMAYLHDYDEHPIDNTLKLAGLVSPWIQVPEAYEGVKAGIELSHAAIDAAQAGREVQKIRKGTNP
jgi:hypothetical protein